MEVILNDSDIFQCGSCKAQFSSLYIFMQHKQQCFNLTSDTYKADLIETQVLEDSSSCQVKVYIHSTESEIAGLSLYSESALSPQNQSSIVIDETELLPFNIENSQEIEDHTLPDTVKEDETEIILGLTEEIQASTVHENCLSLDLKHRHSITSNTDKFLNEKYLQLTKIDKFKSNNVCNICGKELSKNCDLQHHIRAHTGEKPYQCIVCGRSFSQKSNVKKHMSSHKVWPNKNIYCTLPNASFTKVKENEFDNLYMCQFCSSSFSSYFELRSHLKIHSDEKVFKCNQKKCQETFGCLSEFLNHIQFHNDMEYSCHICLQSFHSLESLREHQFNHSSVPHEASSSNFPVYYQCTICLNKYISADALDSHLQNYSHHFPCKNCNKIFKSERFLRRHYKVHNSSALISCPQCMKKFKNEQSLKVHLIIHTGRKLFQCQLCHASFYRKDNFKRHLAIHSPKKYKCPYKYDLGCNREFTRNDKLRLHVQTHMKRAMITLQKHSQKRKLLDIKRNIGPAECLVDSTRESKEIFVNKIYTSSLTEGKAVISKEASTVSVNNSSHSPTIKDKDGNKNFDKSGESASVRTVYVKKILFNRSTKV